MIPTGITKLYLENHVALVEAKAGGDSPLWEYALLGESLEDPSIDSEWIDIAEHEVSYAIYERQEINAEDIIGPEHWSKGYYLRYPQRNFPYGSTGADVRWIAIICTGTLDTVLVSLEKLEFLWNATTAGTPLRHSFKGRSRHAVP